MHHPTDRMGQWVHPMKDRSDDPSHHERTLLPQSKCRIMANSVRLHKELTFHNAKNIYKKHGPDGAMAKSLANGLEGTGFTSQYQHKLL